MVSSWIKRWSFQDFVGCFDQKKHDPKRFLVIRVRFENFLRLYEGFVCYITCEVIVVVFASKVSIRVARNKRFITFESFKNLRIESVLHCSWKRKGFDLGNFYFVWKGVFELQNIFGKNLEKYQKSQNLILKSSHSRRIWHWQKGANLTRISKLGESTYFV